MLTVNDEDMANYPLFQLFMAAKLKGHQEVFKSCKDWLFSNKLLSHSVIRERILFWPHNIRIGK